MIWVLLFIEASIPSRTERVPEVEQPTRPVQPLIGPAGEPAFNRPGALQDIDNGSRISDMLMPAWGTGEVAKSGQPDIEGAFRFICSPSHVAADDPIVYPGQPGRSHLHQFFGNEAADAHSTYGSLRARPKSSCGQGNASGYWIPAMLDGAGHVVQPDYVSVYYKRRPISDPKCHRKSGDPQAEGDCVSLPNGLRFIFGYDMLNPKGPATGAGYFNCDGKTATPGHYKTLTEAAANCPSQPNSDGSVNRLGVVITAPNCWDGKSLDSPDHRRHMSYPGYGDWGYLKCPASHPFVVPGFTLGVWYTVDANVGGWRLSSDDMIAGAAAGTTLHADWWGAWDNQVEAMWMDNCINKLLTCSGGDLGNGRQMKGAAAPPWNWGVNPQRLVAVPERADSSPHEH